MSLRWIAILVLVATFTVSAQVIRDSGGGIVDGGGGDLIASTDEHIHETLKQIKAHMAVPTISNPLSALKRALPVDKDTAPYSIKALFFNDTDSKLGRELTAKLRSFGDPSHLSPEQLEKFESIRNTLHHISVPGRALVDSEFRIKEKCYDKHGDEKAASVERFELGSPICISMTMLRKVPKYSLYDELVGLMSHEMMHLLGEGEVVGEQVQNYVTWAQNRIQLLYLTRTFGLNLKGTLLRLKTTLSNLNRDYGNSHSHPLYYPNLYYIELIRIHGELMTYERTIGRLWTKNPVALADFRLKANGFRQKLLPFAQNLLLDSSATLDRNALNELIQGANQLTQIWEQMFEHLEPDAR